MRTPIAVAIGDVHYNSKNLKLASESLRQALLKAEQLGIPLVINGDLNDEKSILRAECVNDILALIRGLGGRVYANIGNHDLINHESTEHSLYFLNYIAVVINRPTFISHGNFYIVPYRHHVEDVRAMLKEIPDNAIVFMHCGLMGAVMGAYLVDKSSITPDDIKRFKKVILSHYHKAQIIGNAEYLGSPYSVTAAEANDGPKGFGVVYDDGFIERIPTNLRKHVTLDLTIQDLERMTANGDKLDPQDVIWLKVTGSYSLLEKLNKVDIGNALIGHSNFKLDKIPNDDVVSKAELVNLSNDAIMDKLIDDSSEDGKQKQFLKNLWRETVK